MSLLVAAPLLALIGLLHAGIWALFYDALTKKHLITTAILDGVLTSFGYAAWAIMDSTGHASAPPGIVAYSLGGAVGTYLILRRQQAKG